MVDASETPRRLPKPGLLRREIGIALLLKIILLTGLWLVIFRWPEQPVPKPDIAQHFALPANPDVPTQTIKESRHVR